MTLILTNDDGIDAPGIKALLKAVDAYVDSYKIMTVAPKDHQSGCGHQVTTASAIALHKRSDNEYAIAGTPADCTRVALSHLCKDVKYVLSGINAGGNLGVDAYISGTVAAVREAAMHGVPGIAISHYRKGKLDYNWDAATRWTKKIIAELFTHPLESGSFWNVNLPHLLPDAPEPEIVFCQPCSKALPVDFRIEGTNLYYVGDYSKRPHTPGSDIDVCFSGNIAVTQLKV